MAAVASENAFSFNAELSKLSFDINVVNAIGKFIPPRTSVSCSLPWSFKMLQTVVSGLPPTISARTTKLAFSGRVFSNASNRVPNVEAASSGFKPTAMTEPIASSPAKFALSHWRNHRD